MFGTDNKNTPRHAGKPGGIRWQKTTKRDGNMESEKLNMARFLGRPIRLLMNNGRELKFRPTAFWQSLYGNDDKDFWVGTDTEGSTIEIRRDEFQMIIK